MFNLFTAKPSIDTKQPWLPQHSISKFGNKYDNCNKLIKKEKKKLINTSNLIIKSQINNFLFFFFYLEIHNFFFSFPSVLHFFMN